MNKKELALRLPKLKRLERYNLELEQYQTESELAADLLWNINLQDPIKGKIIADLGCGNGIFGVGCLLLKAKSVYFVDKDNLDIARNNCHGFKNAKFVNCDILEFNKKVDVVIMNPPFGVQKRKADKSFLETAMKISRKIYSIHKIESKNFIEKLCKENNFTVKYLMKFKFPLRKSYKFHKKERYYVDVGLWCIEKLK